jgi:hypothetical protein
LSYRNIGWSVIPAWGKTPAVRWKRYQHQRPSFSQLRRWFSGEGNAGQNLAIVTGSVSQLVVVDCDSPEDATWWEHHFPTTPLAATTGRGGKHFYYRFPSSPIGNRSRLLRRQIDLRAEGGLVIAPPSIHPETETAYCWKGVPEASVANLPEFQPDWIQLRNSSRSGIGSRAGSRISSNEKRRVLHGAAYIEKIEAVSGQGGHNATFRAACRLRDSGLPAEEALKVMRAWNRTNARPPWTDGELLHKIDDAYHQAED